MVDASPTTQPIVIEVQPLPAATPAADTADLVSAEVRNLGRQVAAARPLMPTRLPAIMPTNTPVAPPDAEIIPPRSALPLAGAATEPSPTAMPTVTSTDLAPETPAATATPSPVPTATPIPIDVVKEVGERLPAVLFSASFLLLVLVIATGIAIVRGPRDI